MTPNTRKEGLIFYISMKSLQKRGQKSTILKNIGLKILQLLGVLKEGGQKSMILKKYLWAGDQNSTSPCGKRAKERVKILLIWNKIFFIAKILQSMTVRERSDQNLLYLKIRVNCYKIWVILKRVFPSHQSNCIYSGWFGLWVHH